MRPEDLHDLLVGAVPPLITPPDRMARVRRRVVRARGLRVSASVLATLAVAGGAAFGVHALAPVGRSGANAAGSTPSAPAAASSDGSKLESSSPSPSATASAGANSLGVGECPRSLDLMTVAQGGTDYLGMTIQAPLLSVTVCRYRHALFDTSIGNADLLAGPKQGASDAFASAIQHPMNSGQSGDSCALPQPNHDISVDVVYVIDAQGKAHEFGDMRYTCAGGGNPGAPVRFEAAVDQLLGPPY